MNFIEELKWRGMLQDMMPGTEEQLQKEMTAGYVGFDPTADSLHVGNLAAIMLLKHFQVCGHKPYALVGGATGMVGDPSGKSAERKFLDEDTLRHNQECIKNQLQKFLDFSAGANAAIIVNNYDWFKDISLLDFLRDAGKNITISYMMAKDSVKNRMETGLSFTEFSYQLIQGYDFFHLNEKHNCKLQMGGSDQWGNITTGTELIRRKSDREAFALTGPLITKSDGTKFGKSEGGNVWLDAKKTSPYQFYQFWLNSSDVDALKYIKIFTTKSKEEIESIAAEHNADPGQRALQKALAKAVTITVHSEEDYNRAVEASQILFGKATEETLRNLSEQDLLEIFAGVPRSSVAKEQLLQGIAVIDFLSEVTKVSASKGEARRSIQGNAIAINKAKVNETKNIDHNDLISDKYILIQTGKKNYHLVVVE
ncbi:MAG: tyrosine--tRNA ligase [Bacteroidetes bacterium]|nr:tyrosine--tRNA ligase [Bacteroidota bacterium]